MKINPHIGDLDPTLRRRQVDAKRAADAADKKDPAAGSNPVSASIGLRQSDITRYVDMLKDMDPVDLHRVDEIRQRIEDGSYSSDLDELVEPLLDFLGDEPVA